MASSRVGAITNNCGCFAAGSIFAKRGKENAAVLPLPVCAIPSTSLPSKRAGIQACWMGEGVSKPRSETAFRMNSGKPKSLKVILSVIKILECK